MECKHCGFVNDPDATFCVGCGQALEAPAIPAEPVAPPVEETVVTETPKKKGKKPFIFAGIGVLLAAVVAVCAIFLLGKKDKTVPTTLYIKDGNLYYYNMQNDMVVELTDDLLAGELEIKNVYSNLMLLCARVSADGNRVFFVQDMEYVIDENNQRTLQFDLCYMDPNGKNARPEKIASGVSYYQISQAGDKVAYMKGNNLHISDLEDDEKIAKDVSGYFLGNDDLTKIGYMNSEQNIYLWQEGEDKEKVASAVAKMVYIAPDFSFGYYINDEGSLYKQVIGEKEKEKIASDVTYARYFNSGELYYTVSKQKSVSILDYVVDDYAEADSKMVQPQAPVAPEQTEAPEKPLRSRFDDEESYQAALSQYEQDYKAWEEENTKKKEEYDKQKEAYDKEADRYLDKQARDALRKQLQDGTVEYAMDELYYFDGKDSVLVTDRLSNSNSYSYSVCAEETAVATFYVYSAGEVPQIKLSEIQFASEAETQIREAIAGTQNKVLVVGKTLYADKLKNAESICVSTSGKTVYYKQAKDPEAQEKTYDLYKLDTKSGKAELYDTEVFDCFIPAETEDVYYWKNVTREAPNAEMSQGGYTSLNFGDLYFNKNLVVEEAPIRSVEYAQGALYYYAEYDYEKRHGTLHRYANGEDEVISDEVHLYTLAPDGEILYIYDYSQKRQCGTLYRYNDGDPIQVDEDVQYFLPDASLIQEYLQNGLRGG